MAKSNIQKMAELVTGDARSVKAAVKAAINGVAEARRLLNVAAACCVVHYAQHGNTTLATNLVNSIDGMRSNDLKAWFVKHGMRWVQEEGEKQGKFLKHDKKHAALVATREEMGATKFATELVTNTFNTDKKEPVFNGFDFEAQLKSLIGRATKVSEDETKANHDKTDLRGLDEARKLLKSIQVVSTNDNDVAEAEAVAA